MEAEETIRQALLGAGYKPEEIELETTSSGKVGGFVISKKFAGISQMERQRTLWSELSEHLDPEKLRSIVSLLTMTPEETDDEDARSASG
jgi:acid stress-induced BolA-like protein IbaG/YrbA